MKFLNSYTFLFWYAGNGAHCSVEIWQKLRISLENALLSVGVRAIGSAHQKLRRPAKFDLWIGKFGWNFAKSEEILISYKHKILLSWNVEKCNQAYSELNIATSKKFSSRNTLDKLSEMYLHLISKPKKCRNIYLSNNVKLNGSLTFWTLFWTSYKWLFKKLFHNVINNCTFNVFVEIFANFCLFLSCFKNNYFSKRCLSFTRHFAKFS